MTAFNEAEVEQAALAWLEELGEAPELLEFFFAIRENREPSISAKRCRRVVSVLDAAKRSMVCGAPQTCT